MDVREGYHYTKEHEWISVEDNIGTVGITHYAQEAMGDITYVELPTPDTEVEQFEQFASLESVKAASDIYAPVSGRIVEVNQDLEDNPGLINRSCYDHGWIAKIEIFNPSELNKLMDAQEYQKYLETLD